LKISQIDMLNFGNKILILIFIVFFLILFYFKSDRETFQYNDQILKLFDEKQYKFIAHAGGGIDQHAYTNSLEAVNLSISKGFKLIEIDLRETKDKYFVGVNSWQKYKKDNLFEKNDINNEPLYLKEFKKIKILNKYTPLTANEINKIFTENNDLILVTDKTNNFKKINSDFFFDKKRIIVEIFGKKNYFKSIKYGIINPMFAASSDDYDFIIENNIKLITAHSKDIINNEETYKKLISHGVKILAYTSSNKKFIEENLDNTFSGIYTDFWDIKNNNCSSNECKTY